jgi:shikimate kinase
MVTSHTIYVIGFMGSGKTTAGKKLASLLGWAFIDLDKKIEEYTAKTIPEIFAQDGENYFRTVETKILKSLESKTDIVISTGGGTPCNGDNMDYMLNTGLTVYLKMTTGQLKCRLNKSNGDRPLLKNLDSKGLFEFIEQKLAIREKWYRRSEITVKGNNLDINLLHSVVRNYLNIGPL